MTRLEVLNARIFDLRGKVNDVFGAKKADGSYTTEQLATIKGINDELSPLVTEFEALSAATKVEQETTEYMSKNSPVGERLPGGEAGQSAYAIKMPNGEVVELKDSNGNFLADSVIQEKIEAASRRGFMADPGSGMNGGLGTEKTALELGEAFVKSAAFLEFNKSDKKGPSRDVQIKTLLDTGSFPIANTRSNLLIPFATRRMVIADLFPQGTIAQPRFLYVEETVNTNNAAFVAEGGTKPESALEFEEMSADVRKIATVLPVTDEMFEDAPAMRSYVQGRLTQFLLLAEDFALMKGNGTAPNIRGILNVSGILSQPKGGDTKLDCIYKATQKVENESFLPVSGMVMHPSDWTDIRLSKDANGQYLLGSPLNGDTERLFGYPVVKSPVMNAGVPLVGAFDLGAQILRRTGVTFAASTEHADFFITNKLMLRVETRLAFPVFRPQAFCEADFTE